MIQQRLLSREKGTVLDHDSEADWQVYLKMKAQREKISRNHFVIDTSRDIALVTDKILREIKK